MHGLLKKTGAAAVAATIAAVVWTAPGAAAPNAGGAADPLSDSIRSMYAAVKANVTQSAANMPEEHYAFQPTADVRTFGQQIGHLAFAAYHICAGMKGEASPETRDLEALTKKAHLVAAIDAAFAYCDGAYASLTDAGLADPVNFFGQQQVRHYPATYHLVHANDHYGNIVTYMRMKGIVPPSSAR